MPEQNDTGQGNDQDIDTSHPWLVMPYFDGDEGRVSQRPLSKITPPVVSWLCPAIHVQGVGYSAAPGSYLPDRPLSIVVEVDNRGVPNGQVTAELFWAAPSTGFANPTYIGAAAAPVAGRSVAGAKRLPPIVWTPASARIPPHFCLLAHVSCTPPESDRGGSAPDPLNDRHWAQYNLQAVVLSAAMGYTGAFWAANPGKQAATYTVTVRALPEELLRTVARVVRAEPVAIRGRQLALHRADDAALAQGRLEAREDSLVLELAAGERVPLVVTARDLKLGAQQFTALELRQTRVQARGAARPDAEREHDGATGSLGIVLFAYAPSRCGSAC